MQTATQLKLLQFAGMETAESFVSDSLVPAGHDTQGAHLLHDISYLLLLLLPSEKGSMDFLLSKAEPHIYSCCFSFSSELAKNRFFDEYHALSNEFYTCLTV